MFEVAMPTIQSRGSAVRFSTANLQEKHRVEIWREEFGRTHLKAEFEPLPNIPFACTAAVISLPSLSLLMATTGGIRVARTPSLIVDGNDDLLLNIMDKGNVHTSHMGHEVVRGAGGAILISVSDAGAAVFPEPAQYTSLSLPRAGLRAITRNAEAALMKPIPKENTALRLLRAYLSAVEGQIGAGLDPGLAHAAADHIMDLAALALGATRDGAELAKGRGLRAARLCAIKTEISNNPARRGLSAAAVAARHGVSARYVQTLFEESGTTFTAFVQAQRLALVHRRLVDARFANRTIGELIEEAGAGDPSHFKRAFRQRFRAAPTEVRQRALSSQSENSDN
jgi:AraC-like DNA-binding protein